MKALPFPDPPLTDGVILLRPKRRSDLETIARAMQDPEIPRWTTVPEGYTLNDAHLWFERSEQQRLDGEHLNLLAVDADDPDRFLASVSLIVERPRVAEIGYLTVAEARGQGICTRAVILLRDWAAHTLGFELIEVIVHRDNLPSRRCAEKAGFVDSGERREPPRTPATEGRSHMVYVWKRPAG